MNKKNINPYRLHIGRRYNRFLLYYFFFEQLNRFSQRSYTAGYSDWYYRPREAGIK